MERVNPAGSNICSTGSTGKDCKAAEDVLDKSIQGRPVSEKRAGSSFKAKLKKKSPPPLQLNIKPALKLLVNTFSISQSDIDTCLSRNSSLSGLSVTRFDDIPCLNNKKISDKLHANIVSVNGKNLAIASQYPIDKKLEVKLENRECQMVSFFKTIVKQNVSCIVVLNPEHEMRERKLPPYFMEEKIYSDKNSNEEPGVKIQSVLDGVYKSDNVKKYNLAIQVKGNEDFKVPVFHLSNCEDYGAIGKDEIKTLIEAIQSSKQQSSGLPFIHCRAGVGRTGQLIASMAMNLTDIKATTLEQIIKDMRDCRFGIVQSEAQFSALIDYAEVQGRTILNDINLRDNIYS